MPRLLVRILDSVAVMLGGPPHVTQSHTRRRVVEARCQSGCVAHGQGGPQTMNPDEVPSMADSQIGPVEGVALTSGVSPYSEARRPHSL